MKVVNKNQQKQHEAALARLEEIKPEVITLTMVPLDGPPKEIGPGIVAMQGDYYGEMKGQGTIVIAAADIGEAWEEVTE